MKGLLLSLIWLFLTLPCGARTITVDDDGPADFNNIQAAIDDSNDGDIIEVYPGTYTGDGNRDIDFNGLAITVRSTDPNDPNTVAATIIDCNGTEAEPHRGLYFHNAEDGNAVLNGFSITNGYAKFGSGIRCDDSSPMICNCALKACSVVLFGSKAFITGCTISGTENYGLFFHGGPTIEDCTISDNSGKGIVFYNETGEAVVVRISNCTITGNDGGGIYCGGGGSFPIDLSITDCNISGNSTQYDGGGICCDDAFSGTITMTVAGSTISHNSGGGNGGGIWCSETPMPNSVTITNCTISYNQAYDGGGLYKCDWPISGCKTVGNSAENDGGGLYDCDGPISGCTIKDNSAENDGGGLYDCDGPISRCSISGNSAACDAGAFYRCDGPLTNCVISGNAAERGGGVYWSNGGITNCDIVGNFSALGGSAMFACGGPVSNCIIWANSEPAVGLPPSANHTCMQVGYPYPGLGNIEVDPCFVKPGRWVDVNDPNIAVEPNDPNAMWVDGDYHLKSEGWRWDVIPDPPRWRYDYVTSRCIDAGNPGSTLDEELLSIPGDPCNVYGGNLRINMGAYGGTAEASMPPYDWALLSDITNDGIVNFVDFAHLADIYTDQDDELPADFDRDGDIDYDDLHLLTEDWLKQTGWPH